MGVVISPCIIHRDAGRSFTIADPVTGRGIAFGLGVTAIVNFDGLPHNSFRTPAVRAIAADPTRPGHVYAAEPTFVLDPLGNQIDGADLFFARSTDYGETWQSTFLIGP